MLVYNYYTFVLAEYHSWS